MAFFKDPLQAIADLLVVFRVEPEVGGGQLPAEGLTEEARQQIVFLQLTPKDFVKSAGTGQKVGQDPVIRKAGAG